MKTTFLVFSVLCLMLVQPITLSASKLEYEFPTNVTLRLEELDATAYQLNYRAFVESRLGNISNLTLLIETSDNIKAFPKKAGLKLLRANTENSIKFSIKKTNNEPDASGTWIRLRVTYTPDFDEIRSKISDTDTYPDESERTRLLDIITKSQTDNSQWNAALRKKIRVELPKMEES